MKAGHLSDYFVGVAAKVLSAVEVDTSRSNQHEFNGTAPLRNLLGTGRLQEYPARFIALSDDSEATVTDSTITWYDAREAHPTRSEYRLYFRSNPVIEQAAPGDLLAIGRTPEGGLLMIVAEAGSTVFRQVSWLFGLSGDLGTSFEQRDFVGGQDAETGFASRFILDELGIEYTPRDTVYLEELIDRFGLEFPTTVEFSSFARETLDLDPRDDPDEVLMTWVEREELLFRLLEKRIVGERLRNGFWNGHEPDVDEFIQFSLGVQNRRKSRAGYSLEHHLESIFRAHDVLYSRGQATEHRSRPDFLFPGVDQYRDSAFSSERLTMLGVKSTCKDRWRQVLSEAARIPDKHLLTLEPSISENQTAEMSANRLSLVLPERLHATYTPEQVCSLETVNGFLNIVLRRQNSSEAI